MTANGHKPRVILAMPHSGSLHMEAAKAFFAHPSRAGCHIQRIESPNESLLANSFNWLWYRALEARDRGQATHFAMLHADVSARPGWLDVLLAEMQATGADVVSAVVAIKDWRGLTSTAIGLLDDPWRILRRFTVRECLALPETFDAAAAGYPGHPLLVNTGCWLADLSRPWAERVCFGIGDRVSQGPGGRREIDCTPEDWGFSRDLWEWGGSVLATRRCHAVHHGGHGYGVDTVWGAWDVDREYVREQETAEVTT